MNIWKEQVLEYQNMMFGSIWNIIGPPITS